MSEGKGILRFLKFDNLVTSFADYLEKRVELLKIELKEDAAIIAARVIVLLFFAMILFMIILFLSILLGTYLNTILDSNYLGFAFVSLFYLILLIILFLLKSKFNLDKKIEGYILQLFDR